MLKKTKKTVTDRKDLYRSDNNRVIGGVAGGLGEYYNIDPTIVRIIFILLSIYGGSGIFIYLVLWLLIPRKSQGHGDTNKTIKENIAEMKSTAHDLAKENNSRKIVGVFLLIFGFAFLLDNFGVIDLGSIWRFWPVLLIIAGYLILVRHE